MTLQLNELQAVSDEYCDNTSSDIYHKANVLLYKLLSKKKTIGGGLKIREILEYAAPSGNDYAASTSLPTSKETIFNAARWDWAAYFAPIVYDLDDTLENGNEAGLINIVTGKIKAAQKEIRTTMGSGIYAKRADATNSNGFNGLADLFNTTDTTPYGDIQEHDMAGWKANVITTSEAISFEVLQSIRRTAQVDNNNEGVPDLYITTQELKDAFELSLTQNARYTNPDLVKAGFDNILFGGVPVVADNKCSSGCYGLNTRLLNIYSHKDRNFTKPEWQRPINQPDKYVAYIRWAGNLTTKNRAAHCYHSGVTA